MNVRYDKNGLVPVIAQDARTGRILMLAWANREALSATKETGYAHYYSRSRSALWKKGETSGHLQTVVAVRTDCDADTILYQVHQEGAACHTGEPTCFFRVLDGDQIVEDGPARSPDSGMVERLQRVIESRKGDDPSSSYTASLLSKGMPKVLEKIAEESAELCDALREEEDRRVVSEAADLLYHVLVGFVERGIAAEEVDMELARRFGVSGLVEKASRGRQQTDE